MARCIGLRSDSSNALHLTSVCNALASVAQGVESGLSLATSRSPAYCYTSTLSLLLHEVVVRVSVELTSSGFSNRRYFHLSFRTLACVERLERSTFTSGG